MQMVFVGLDIIVPLMTVELLKFPTLSEAYFQLLAHMLEVYPERVLALPGKAILLCSFIASEPQTMRLIGLCMSLMLA